MSLTLTFPTVQLHNVTYAHLSDTTVGSLVVAFAFLLLFPVRHHSDDIGPGICVIPFVPSTTITLMTLVLAFALFLFFPVLQSRCHSLELCDITIVTSSRSYNCSQFGTLLVQYCNDDLAVFPLRFATLRLLPLRLDGICLRFFSFRDSIAPCLYSTAT